MCSPFPKARPSTRIPLQQTLIVLGSLGRRVVLERLTLEASYDPGGRFWYVRRTRAIVREVGNKVEAIRRAGLEIRCGQQDFR